MSSPPEPSRRRRRHSRKYAPAQPPPEEQHAVKKKEQPRLTELLGDYFTTGGRAGAGNRAELRTIERETTRTQDSIPGDTVLVEPPRPEAELRWKRAQISAAEAERRHQQANIREQNLANQEVNLRQREETLRNREADLRKRETDLRQYEHEQRQNVFRPESSSNTRIIPSRARTPQPPEVFNRGIIISERRPDDRETKLDDRTGRLSKNQDRLYRDRDREQHAEQSRQNPIIRQRDPEPESRARSRLESGSEDGLSPQLREGWIDGRRLSGRGGGPSVDGSSRETDDDNESVISYIFYVRYGEIKKISDQLSFTIGEWKDWKLLEHLAKEYRNQNEKGNWLTWRYWWDSFMKEIAALVLIQTEHTEVSYQETPHQGEHPKPPITDQRFHTVHSIDLFGGKEASGQFRYLIRHYETIADSRIMMSQIDKLAMWGQRQRAKRPGHRYYLILQVIEGQNGNAFLLGLLIIMACFLIFGLALGATQASSLSWGDAFSISGFGLACLSGLFALMALGQYLGLEDMNPGNPIGREDLRFDEEIDDEPVGPAGGN